ncbi:MAG: hypothetical protein GKS00_04310 [Alphaproteobacteria bacterium]|nr:hypothetical protein [Alphaproteobacteria bacterium]
MRLLRLVALLLLWSAPLADAAARTVTLPPPADCGPTDGIEAAARALQPGDELILGPGAFCQTGRRLIAVSGTAEKPILIRGSGVGRTVLTRPGKPTERHAFDGTEFRGAHLIIRGIHFRGGKRGLVFHGGAHHVTLEDSEVSHTANNGVTLNNGDTRHFVIRRNHIHHTGNLDRALGRTEGEGLYIGCNDAKCIAHDHVIEDNRIHHLKANGRGGNDGIEIKYGSYGNTVRNNVIHTIAPAFGNTKYPCIFAYGTLDRHQDRPNIIEGNRMWGCGEAIQIVSDAVVRNNTILDSQRGLATYYHKQVPVQRNLRIEKNTFFGTRVDLQFGRQSRKPGRVWKPPPQNIVFADNVIHGKGLKPLVTVDLPKGGGITIVDNAIDDPSPAGLVIKADPDGAIDAKAFVEAGLPN